jgi:uncharacterized membrane protein HdeD (DUF308 family)
VVTFSLRRYESQALASVVLGIVSCISLIVQALLVFRNINFVEWTVLYGNPNRRYIVLAASAVTLLLGFSALCLGFNSAGQRRNDRPQMSWVGFFLGVGVVCLAIVFVFFFRTRAEFVGR